MIQVAIEVLSPGQSIAVYSDVTGHGRERAAQGKLHVGGVGKCIAERRSAAVASSSKGAGTNSPIRGRPRKCFRNERNDPLHGRQKGQLRRLLLRRPLDLSGESPQHQIFAEYLNLVCQALAADLVGRVDARPEGFHRLCALGESELEIGGDV